MFRKLLILGAIAALFTIATAVPASAVAVNTGQGAKTVVPQFNEDDAFSNAHGPLCGADLGCPNNNSHAGAIFPGGLENPFAGGAGPNVGAWNGVFQSNENSAICGISVTAAEIPEALLTSDDPDVMALVAILEANTCE
jgi:hypothetical protein